MKQTQQLTWPAVLHLDEVKMQLTDKQVTHFPQIQEFESSVLIRVEIIQFTTSMHQNFQLFQISFQAFWLEAKLFVHVFKRIKSFLGKARKPTTSIASPNCPWGPQSVRSTYIYDKLSPRIYFMSFFFIKSGKVWELSQISREKTPFGLRLAFRVQCNISLGSLFSTAKLELRNLHEKTLFACTYA